VYTLDTFVVDELICFERFKINFLLVLLTTIQGGILWFQNLTEFPHGALGPVFPILVAGLHYLNVQVLY
jgi:hypothetical protein